MLAFGGASEVLRQIRAGVATAASLDEPWKMLVESGFRYARLRSDWAISGATTRLELDAARTRAHNAFIDSCNILSRAMVALQIDNGWRRTLGEERKTIGDFACHLHCILGLEAR